MTAEYTGEYSIGPRSRSASKLADQVYDRLKDELYIDLLPGAKLTESVTAARLQVSRTPLREALQRLVREGYLEAHLRNGYTVAEVDFKTFNELSHLRALLEIESVRAFVTQGDSRSLTSLEQTWQVRRDQQVTDATELSCLNAAFHATLSHLGGNSELSRLHEQLMQRIALLQRLDFTRADRIDATYDEHAAILQAMRHHDMENAAELLRSHIAHSSHSVQDIVSKSGTSEPELDTQTYACRIPQPY